MFRYDKNAKKYINIFSEKNQQDTGWRMSIAIVLYCPVV